MVPAIVNTHAILGPCSNQTADNSEKQVTWLWMRNDELINTKDTHLSTQSNGSLNVYVSLEEANYMYSCKKVEVFPNKTTIEGYLEMYMITPIVPAFMEHSLVNKTVNWGSFYTFSCIGGGTNITIERKINGKIVNKKKVKVFNNSVIECRVYNNAGEEFSKAYITIYPGSEKWASLREYSNGSLKCQPFKEFLPSTSVCFDVLESEVAITGNKETYYVKNTRFIRVNDRGQALNNLFQTWNSLVVNKTAKSSFWKNVCLEQAKRLFCLLAYPRCIEYSDEDDDDFLINGKADEPIVQEQFVCQQHCMAISTLFCFTSFTSATNEPPLTPFFSEVSRVRSNISTGWMQLMQVAELSSLLNDLFMDVTVKFQSMNLINSLNSAQLICEQLPFLMVPDTYDISMPPCYAMQFNDHHALHKDQLPLQINSSEFVESYPDCYINNGESYRGLAIASPNCVPWVEVEQKSLSSQSVQEEFYPWSALDTLNPTIFPNSFSKSDNAACRNPLGFALQPFCLIRVYRENATFHVPKTCRNLMNCHNKRLADIYEANKHNVTEFSYPNGLEKRKNAVMSLLICSICFVAIFLIVYFIFLRPCKTKKPAKANYSLEFTFSDKVNSELAATMYAALHRRRRILINRRRSIRSSPAACHRFLRFMYSCIDVCFKYSNTQPFTSTSNPSSTNCCLNCFCQRKKNVLTFIPAVNTYQIFTSVDDEDEEVEAFTNLLNEKLSKDANKLQLTNKLTHEPLDSCCNTSVKLGQLDNIQETQQNSKHDPVNSWLSNVKTQDLNTNEIITSHSPNRSTSFLNNAYAVPELLEHGIQYEFHNAFFLASMGKILHPKLKQFAYPRKLLIEEGELAKKAFGRIILARAPFLPICLPTKRSFLYKDCIREQITASNKTETINTINCISPRIVIRTLARNASTRAVVSFFREAELLVEFNHPNILKILGICMPLNPVSLICEYLPEGDLHICLRRMALKNRTSYNTDATKLCELDNSDSVENGNLPSNSTLTPLAILLNMALNICEAMIYIGYKSYVHRDLATRSCLVDSDLTVKLADFSSCRLLIRGVDFIDDGDAALPIRWLPMESVIENRFQIDTDVWSFGVLLWELFTYGDQPYGDATLDEIIQFIVDGKRLTIPENCPFQLYELMLQCWSSNREDRPSFAHIKDCLLKLYDKEIV